MANDNLKDLKNDELLTFYKQATSHYACRRFMHPRKKELFEATPEELAIEIETRMTDENAPVQ